MARYIDADELLKELQEELDFETHMYTEEQNKYFNSGLRCAIRDVEKAPTADVVPKSEVESINPIPEKMAKIVVAATDWQKKNKDKHKAHMREWQRKNKDKWNAYQREWRKRKKYTESEKEK